MCVWGGGGGGRIRVVEETGYKNVSTIEAGQKCEGQMVIKKMIEKSGKNDFLAIDWPRRNIYSESR